MTTTDLHRPNQCLSFSRALFGFAGALLTLSAIVFLVLFTIAALRDGAKGALLRDLDAVTLGTFIGSEAGMIILAALCWRGAGWRDPS
jgi:hypothetical protein